MNKKIKILFILPHSGKGGAQKSILDIIKNVNLNKFEIYAICQKRMEKEYVSQLEKIGVVDEFYLPLWYKHPHVGLLLRIKETLSNLLKSPIQLIAIFKIMKKIKEWNIDVVYSNGSISLVGAVAAHFTGKPHIWYIRELIGKNGTADFLIGEKNAVNLISKLSKIVIVNSNATKNIFDKYCKKNVAVVYNGFDVREYVFRKKMGALANKFNFDKKNIVVGFLANYGKYKRHEDFVRAASLVNRQNKRVKFLIAGINPSKKDRYYLKLKNLVTKFGLQNCVFFLNFQEDNLSLINELDIVASTSLYESFGRTIIEGMLMRKPVVAYNSGAIGELIQDGKTGILIKQGDIKNMAKKIVELIKDKKKMGQLGGNGRKYAVKNFNINEKVREIEGVIIHILK